jgi:hypothetical protein
VQVSSGFCDVSLMTYTRCLVIIPAGPATIREYLDDTIESINHHIGESNCVIAVIDDSRQNKFANVGDLVLNATVITPADYQEGTGSVTRGSLFCKLIYALKRLMRQYRFDVLLRMDTDALMIGDAPHEDAIRFFESRPDVGMVGAFKRRGDGSDKTHAMAIKGRQLTREMSLRHGFKNPALVTTLRRMVKRAEAHGYTRGDMCTGGACFIWSSAIKAMDEHGYFDLDVLRHSKLMDDALMALACYATGYTLADLPEEDNVLAVNWRRLPMPVEELVSRRKKIVHPIKDEDVSIEPTVRAYFQKRRAESHRLSTLVFPR